jgi:hypothetical protein
MKYFHRTSVAPDAVVDRAAAYFGDRMQTTEEGDRRRAFTSSLGTVRVLVQAEGGHYTLVTIETNQPGESELDRVAKRFLSVVHTMAHPAHSLRGAY